PKDSRNYSRFLVHVQVWVTVLDILLCFLLVPVPLFPCVGTLWFGALRNTGVDPHCLVLILIAVGNVAASINICFHYRYEAILSAAQA
ncbi:hypothetical protein PMAYCL1PPCAC_05927, partial [Pristionchus mayeri]